MSDQSTEESSQMEAKNSASMPLLELTVGNVQQPPEVIKACHSAIQKIRSNDEDRESGIGSDSALEASMDSVESLRLPTGKFRKTFLDSLDSTGSSELPADEEQLQTQVVPPPAQPLSKQDDLIKGRVNTGFKDLEGSIETESCGFVPAGTAQEPPIPPREPGSPGDSSKKPNQQEGEQPPECEPWIRTIRIRTVAAITDRAFKYISFSVLCIFGCITFIIAAMMLHLQKFDLWTIITAAVTAILGLFGAVAFCFKAASQAEEDDAERYAISRTQNIRYEVIPERALDPRVFSGGLPMD